MRFKISALNFEAFINFFIINAKSNIQAVFDKENLKIYRGVQNFGSKGYLKGAKK